ncbi:MAG: cell division protein FtsB [Gammaproteobacteria bacterium]|nr:cell division protein FtsB [Gammaproteobacteria bacterium]
MRILFAVALVVLLGLQYTLWFGKGGLRDVSRLKGQIAAQEQEIETLRTRNSELQAEVMDLKQGLDAVEEIARSEMGMVKHGEIFYQFIPKPTHPPEHPAAAPSTKQH